MTVADYLGLAALILNLIPIIITLIIHPICRSKFRSFAVRRNKIRI
jgi:hypothetical protein